MIDPYFLDHFENCLSGYFPKNGRIPKRGNPGGPGGNFTNDDLLRK